MPKREDIRRIMLLGSGPIVIGQACEFDYSGTQAVKTLRQEGYQVILVNSNPATIMTDPGLADRTYVEPITPRMVARIIERERPDALLPTMGGQTALNCAVALAEDGTLARFGVELIGAKVEAIQKAEDRDLFRRTMKAIGLDVPESGVVRSLEEAWDVQARTGYPAIIRPSFTMGGTGGNIAYNKEEFVEFVNWALAASPSHQTLIESSCLGWKEFELEVMRDAKDNVVIICSIENLDPMGIHTGDSITVAPAQTLTDKEYQRMRDAAIKIIRAIGVDTGGCNIQFAVDPRDGRMTVIEMNPRVSRSSALASKATGYPIAKVAAKLAVGYTLDELPNDITKTTPACFEPAIDYVVTKVPRFAFEKFPGSDRRLTTQMKSVGEVMSIGRTFQESLGKALRSLEIGCYGLEPRAIAKVAGTDLLGGLSADGELEKLRELLSIPGPERLWVIAQALRRGIDLATIGEKTAIDPWFLGNIAEVVALEQRVASAGTLDAGLLRAAKRSGLSDRRMAELRGTTEHHLRAERARLGVLPVMKRVDTCAGEFAAETPYLYSTYEEEDESRPTGRKKVMILGGGPNRIGQGIEFDYCCVHAVQALREEGFETVMVNCNPETVSTDYDTADRLYFEPLTLEDVLRIVEIERPIGLIVQYGGQTPLKLATQLADAGVPILGTSPDAIDRAEDRERFAAVVERLGLVQPANGMARSVDEAVKAARALGYPVILRPSYVLGGRGMEVCHDEASIIAYMSHALDVTPDIAARPVLVDQYLAQAIELDVDAIRDATDRVIIGGVLEHIEEAGIHSGDSAMAIPPYSLSPEVVREVERQARLLAQELDVVGLMNVQFAVKGDRIYILEVNPRASRTVPFLSKATGVALAKVAAKVMAGRTLESLGLTTDPKPVSVAVKESVFPFVKFPSADSILGPEMKSTGEVMGLDDKFELAFAKASMAAGMTLPEKGTVFISVADEDKPLMAKLGRRLVAQGFDLLATGGTAAFLSREGVPVRVVKKVLEGRPHIVDAIVNGEVQLVFNTTVGKAAIRDSFSIRRQALTSNVPYFTTSTAAAAATGAIEALRAGELVPRALQDYVRR
ncbi:MAG: carbamoyl-phosphate synthase large subunit [Deltaproteobacteria bacterium]|nr:carbamoyl-phosphate synthase large subunit [Deltaproteobacteria bacterium]